MGRFAAESSIAEASLRKPIERYFHELQEILAGALREAQADGEIAKRLDASELALMLITVVQRGSSFRGFIAIAMPSIEPQRWPSRCSNRCRTAEQDEAGFGVDTRGVRLSPLRSWSAKFRVSGRRSPHVTGAKSRGLHRE